MTKDKDLKRLTRARMRKTGESYTTARAHLLAHNEPTLEVSTGDNRDLATLAGMSDPAIEAKTGRTWAEWVGLLDEIEAAGMPHREIAQQVHQLWDIPGWWAQTVTVGYERIKGLREVGQRRDGSFEANKSKTFPVSLPRLYAAFASQETRSDWLPGIEPEVRTATVGKSMRLTWPDQTSVEIYFTAKGDDKSQVAIQHRKLKSKQAVEEIKTYWAERLTELAVLLDR